MNLQHARRSDTSAQPTRLLLSIFLLVLLPWRASAALPPLPDDFINDDVFTLVVFDLAQVTPAAFDATGRGVIEHIPEIGEQIVKFRNDYDAFVNAGARFVVIAGAETNSEDLYAFMPVAGVFVDADRCDEAALTELIRKSALEFTSEPVIERHGDWIMLWQADRQRLIDRKEDGPLLEIPDIDPARADRLRAGFGAMNGRALAMLMIPTKQMHEEAAENFAYLEQMDPDEEGPESIPMLVGSAVQMHGWIELGHNPSVTGVIEMPEAPMATRLAGLIESLPKFFNAEMEDFGEMLDEEEAQLPPEFLLMYKLLHSFTCVQQGSTVTVSIGQAKLRPILDLAGPVLEKQRKQAKQYEVSSNSRQIGMALIMYSNDNDNQWPASLDELVSSGQMTREELDRLLTHPITGEKNAFKYVKPDRPFDQMDDPGVVAVLYELKNGAINKEGCTCFADGHVEWDGW